jgi:hypothetical protein
MISDVIEHTLAELELYLADYPEIYAGRRRERLIALRRLLMVILEELATPPSDREPR